MEPRKFYLLFVLIAIPVIIVSTVLFMFYKPRAGLENNTAPSPASSRNGAETSAQQTPQESPRPAVAIVKKSSTTLLISCANLPAGTSDIRIFRAKINMNIWVLWKTKTIFPECTEKVVEISVVGKDDLSKYEYYFEAVSEDGRPIWISEPLTPATAPAGATTTPSQSTSSNPAPPENQPPAAPAPPPAPSASSSATSTQFPSGTVVYYTPAGNISGTAVPPSENFRVLYTNKRIEIGWQYLPEGTTDALVYRADSLDGTWERLLAQTDPQSPYFIRIVDHTLNEPHYYRLDAMQSTTLIETFGPVLLLPLAE